MTEDELNNDYFDWMYRLVYSEEYSRKPSYRKLLMRLNDTEFYYILEMDGNRAEDGIDLRYRFADAMGYDHRIIASYLDIRPCSVLEMMVALAIRCEEQIMSDPDIGDRTARWFWGMVENLGLADNPEDADYILERFLNREYAPNGEGGLFTVENRRRDMRDVEIWYQMCWHLNDILETNEKGDVYYE